MSSAATLLRSLNVVLFAVVVLPSAAHRPAQVVGYRRWLTSSLVSGIHRMPRGQA